MSAPNKSVLILLLASLTACGQQLVEFANGNGTGNPTVTSTDPLDVATDVGVGRSVNATFSEAMDPAAFAGSTFTLKQGATTIAGTVTYSGMTATFVPTLPLAAGTLYDAMISTAAKNPAGAGLAADYKWRFTTGTGPSVIFTDPANLATSVPINKHVTAVFSEDMAAATVTSASFLLKNGAVAVPGAVTYSGRTAEFAPTNPLDPSTKYTATVTAAAKSPAGRPLSADFTWSFTTAARAVALAINLRGAASFGVASRAGMTSTGVTVINGDVALHPLASCTDSTGGPGNSSQSCLVQTYASPTGLTVKGKIYWAGDPFDNGGTANSVTNDLQIAWNEGQNKADTNGPVGAGELGGKTITPGVYHNGALGLQAGGICTLDAQNDANAVFIFKVDSSFVDSGTLLLKSRIDLVNGAQARNVWFVTGLDATIGSGTIWNGNILAGRTATIKDGSAVMGRVLAGASGAGAITLTGAASPSSTSISVPQ